MSAETPTYEHHISDDEFREILNRYGEIPKSLIEYRISVTDQKARRKWAKWDEEQSIKALEPASDKS